MNIFDYPAKEWNPQQSLIADESGLDLDEFWKKHCGDSKCGVCGCTKFEDEDCPLCKRLRSLSCHF